MEEEQTFGQAMLEGWSGFKFGLRKAPSFLVGLLREGLQQLFSPDHVQLFKESVLGKQIDELTGNQTLGFAAGVGAWATFVVLVLLTLVTIRSRM